MQILQNKSELQYTKKTDFEEQNSSVKTKLKIFETYLKTVLFI